MAREEVKDVPYVALTDDEPQVDGWLVGMELAKEGSERNNVLFIQKPDNTVFGVWSAYQLDRMLTDGQGHIKPKYAMKHVWITLVGTQKLEGKKTLKKFKVECDSSDVCPDPIRF